MQNTDDHRRDIDEAPWYADAPPVAKPRKRKSAKIVREDDVEGKYVAAREAEGKLVLKVKVLGRPGYPDRLVLGTAKPLADFLYSTCGYGAYDAATEAQRLLGLCFHFTELKKTKRSPFQPKQKTIIPMLRKRGFKVDVVHG